MIPGQQLYQSVKTAIRMLQGRRRDQAAFFVAALCFSGGFALTRKLVPDFNTDGWIARLQIALYAIGAIAFLYGIWRVWRLVNPAELPPAKDRPSAIKGPMAFTEADGELFRKLGRESELQKLLGLVLDDQVFMIVVRGASGAGKTSLLRAGLKHILGDRAFFHYWEAVPVEPDKGVLRAIRERWPEGAAKPATLVELINPSDALGRQSHVVVLDQFEQLRGSQGIFQLLRRIVRESKPPHRITWVIAFRREFSADWLDFISPEQENGVRPPQDVSLRLFTAEQAREVIGQLANESDLKDSVEQSVVDNLVEAATVDGEVSPVDIGIGLLVLTELHERQSGQTITKRDYQFAGGAEGLLTQYISRCLDPYSKESQEAILKAMLALRDPEVNRQRLATGLTINELAAEAGADTRVLKLQLNRLVDRDIRLLEAETPTDGSAVRYRLPHERLIPALYRLTGKLLAEVDQAKVKFQNAFQAWQTNDKRSRYLLKGKELRLVQRYETQIPWGHDEQEKKNFLFRSKRQVRDLTPLEQLKGLTQLELYLDGSQVRDLKPLQQLKELKQLALGLGDSHVIDLMPLQQLKRLTQLTLNLGGDSSSRVNDLKQLEQLEGLTQLALSLSGSQVIDLNPLQQLKGLTQLTLILSGSQVSDLKPLKQLKKLTQLALALSGGHLSDLEFREPLTELTFDFSGTEVSDLKLLEQFKQLTQLTLEVRDLKLIQQLKGLTQLTVFFSHSEVSDLKPIEQLKGLTRLTLYLNGTQVSDLKPLQQLHGLTQLTLDLNGSQVSDLKPLQQLNGLTQLTLYLNGTQVSDLKPLQQLNGLTQLTLYLDGSQVSDLKLLDPLKDLTLDLNIRQVSDLKPLERLKRLTQLTLYGSGSEISDLEPLRGLISLRRLAIETATRTQRMSLRNIPASLVELEF